MKWVLVYWMLGLSGQGFTGQVYFEDRELCEKARDVVSRGAIRSVCVMSARTEN